METVFIIIDPEATGKNICRLMKLRGKKVKDISKDCGVSAQAVYKWLSGKSLPSLDNLKALSLALKTTMQSILVTDENALFCAPDAVLWLNNFRLNAAAEVMN